MSEKLAPKALLRADAMKQRILETADRLFYYDGIRAIGVDTIAAEVGISKRTLYNHFPSKEDLIAAYLKRRTHLPQSGKEPVEQILRTFERLEEGFANRQYRGCPFVNAVAELGDSDKEARDIARSFKLDRRAWFRGLLEQLGVVDAANLAIQLALLVDGAVANHLVLGDPAIARAAKETAIVLLRNAGVKLTEQQCWGAARRSSDNRAPRAD